MVERRMRDSYQTIKAICTALQASMATAPVRTLSGDVAWYSNCHRQKPDPRLHGHSRCFTHFTAVLMGPSPQVRLFLIRPAICMGPHSVAELDAGDLAAGRFSSWSDRATRGLKTSCIASREGPTEAILW